MARPTHVFARRTPFSKGMSSLDVPGCSSSSGPDAAPQKTKAPAASGPRTNGVLCPRDSQTLAAKLVLDSHGGRASGSREMRGSRIAMHQGGMLFSRGSERGTKCEKGKESFAGVL